MTAILYDLFPAFVGVMPPDNPLPVEELRSGPVSPGAYQVQTGRVIITQDRILVAKDSPQGPIPVFSEPYAPGSFHKSASRTEDSYVTTLSGKKLAFRKDQNCGCGSRLRSWNPYGVLSSSKDPTE